MIPNIVHFVFGLAPDFGGKPFSLVHYLGIRSAIAVNRPDKVYFHYEYEPEGVWWEKIRPRLSLNKIKAPTEIFGNPLLHMAHKSDVVDLQILHEMGGVYLDIDTICVKPYHDFLHRKVVMGHEHKKPVFYDRGDKIRYRLKETFVGPFARINRPGIKGLSSAVIFAEPGSEFISLWLDSYKTFRSKAQFDAYWSEHSVTVPYQLAKDNPGLISVVTVENFYIPYYDPKGLRLLFEKTTDFPSAYVHHLWESLSWDRYCLPMTPEYIRSVDSTYNRLARRFL